MDPRSVGESQGLLAAMSCTMMIVLSIVSGPDALTAANRTLTISSKRLSPQR